MGLSTFVLILLIAKSEIVLTYNRPKRILNNDVLTQDEVILYFYTQQNVENASAVVTLRNESSFPLDFDRNKETVFLVHGWRNNMSSNMNTLIRTAVLQKYNVNLFVVDWDHSTGSYLTAYHNVKSAGDSLGQFLNYLSQSYDYPLGMIKLIGHSLGAHICGIAGKITKGLIKLIIGLDPAGPFFTKLGYGSRLAKGDAKYVQVIHTCTKFLGFKSPIGDSDFYPNGGGLQPGCPLKKDFDGACSHARAYRYYAESISSGDFIATNCSSYKDYLRGKCKENEKTQMGLYIPDSLITGVFYLKTNSYPPYALGDDSL